MRYPVVGPTSIIACPRHGLAVALSEEGWIVSACPARARVADAAEARLNAIITERLAAEEAWSTSA